MKVGRWKVLGLAGVLALGYVATSEAAQIKVTNETFADVGLNMKVWYQNRDERSNSTTDSGWRVNRFGIGQSKVYFVGQVTKLFQFYSEIDYNDAFKGASSSPGLNEGGINLAFAKEFQALIGRIRKPFTKAQINSGYAYLTPQGYWLDPQNVLGPTARDAIRGHLGPTDQGLVLHGDLAGGMLNYRIGVFNEDRTRTNKQWIGSATTSWGTPSIASGEKENDLKNIEYAARIEFQPLMLGFKPEPAATITGKSADTRLGARDIFIIGLGYNKEKHTPKVSGINEDLDRTGWTIDVTFEKKFGNIVPNLQVGYISLDESHFYNKYSFNATNLTAISPKKGDTEIWYIQGQLLSNQVVGFGKPAIAFRYEKIKADGEYVSNGTIGAPVATTVHRKDLEVSTFGLALNYYIKGQAARISLGFDTTKYDEAAGAFLKRRGTIPSIKFEDRVTDWYLYFQSQF